MTKPLFFLLFVFSRPPGKKQQWRLGASLFAIWYLFPLIFLILLIPLHFEKTHSCILSLNQFQTKLSLLSGTYSYFILILSGTYSSAFWENKLMHTFLKPVSTKTSIFIFHQRFYRSEFNTYMTNWNKSPVFSTRISCVAKIAQI